MQSDVQEDHNHVFNNLSERNSQFRPGRGVSSPRGKGKREMEEKGIDLTRGLKVSFGELEERDMCTGRREISMAANEKKRKKEDGGEIKVARRSSE